MEIDGIYTTNGYLDTDKLYKGLCDHLVDPEVLINAL